MSEPPNDTAFDQIAFDHIAIGAERIADTTPVLVGALGGASMNGGPSPEFRAWQWRYANGGVIEVLEPNGPVGGFMHRFLTSRGPGIHHVTFKVPDLRTTCDRAEALGYQIVGYDDRNPGWMEAFLHPKQALGIVVQFAQSDPTVGGDWESDDPPPSPAPAAPAASIVGLRMRCPGAELARRQWGGACGGDESDVEEDLVFSWQGSPMRIRVEIDEGEPAGPIGIEVEGVDVSSFASAGLGVRFLGATTDG